MSNLDAIYHFAKVSERLATAGQPKPDQFAPIKAAGYDLIINLATGTTEEDVKDEPQIVADLEMAYQHIPVDWQNPATSDFEQFVSVMAVNADNKVFVHCIANYRVSAFVMLYRVIKQDVPLAEAKAFKDTIWNPEHIFPIWDRFIADTLKAHGIDPS